MTRFISLTFLPNYDEWYYLASWNGIKNGGVLYKTILDNKPPLAYFLYAIPDVLSLYVTLSILSAVIAYFIAKIAQNFYAGCIFLCITGAVPSYMELNLEYWILACIVPAYYFVLTKQSIFWHRWAYFLCGTSLMIKQHSLLLVLPIVIYGLYSTAHLFKKSIYFAGIIPLLCFFYLVYMNILSSAYEWTVKYNFEYKDLSETRGYIWKRFVYGQLFALPVYAGIFLSIKNIKSRLDIFLLFVVLFAIVSVWIGRALYLHYQLLIFPFLIVFFYRMASVKHQKYVLASMVLIFLFGQISYVYAYVSPHKIWINRIEGVVNYQEQKGIKSLLTDKCIVFSADSTVGIDYRKVKYILFCQGLEYLKKLGSVQKQLFSCDFYLADAIYVVDKACLNKYVGDLRYKIVYEYGHNVGIEIEHCE